MKINRKKKTHVYELKCFVLEKHHIRSRSYQEPEIFVFLMRPLSLLKESIKVVRLASGVFLSAAKKLIGYMFSVNIWVILGSFIYSWSFTEQHFFSFPGRGQQ